VKISDELFEFSGIANIPESMLWAGQLKTEK